MPASGSRERWVGSAGINVLAWLSPASLRMKKKIQSHKNKAKAIFFATEIILFAVIFDDRFCVHCG